jgi:hypothetical protein
MMLTDITWVSTSIGGQRVDVKGRMDGLRKMQEGGDDNLGSLVLVILVVALVALVVGLLESRRRQGIVARERQRKLREEEERRQKEAKEREEAAKMASGARRFGRRAPAPPVPTASDREEAPLADLWRMVPGDPLILASADRSHAPVPASWMEHGPEGLSILLPPTDGIPLPDGHGWIIRREASGDVAVWGSNLRSAGEHPDGRLIVAVTHGPGIRISRHGAVDVTLVGSAILGIPSSQANEASPRPITVMISRLGFRCLQITGDTTLEKGEEASVSIAFPDEVDPVEVRGRVRLTERDDVGRAVATLHLEQPDDRGLAVIARHLSDLVPSSSEQDR